MRRSKLKNNFLSSFFTREISFHTRETQIELPLRILLKLLAFHNRRRPNESKPNSPPPPYNSSIRSRKNLPPSILFAPGAETQREEEALESWNKRKNNRRVWQDAKKDRFEAADDS